MNNIIKTLLLLLSLFITFNSATVSAAGGVAGLNSLSNDIGLGNNEDEILEPDVAFKLTTDIKDGNNITANWQIADKHYLYRDKFKFALKEGQGVQLGNINLSAGETKVDEFFGKIQVFHHGTEVNVPLIRTSKDATTVKIQFTYQGCAEETGICYPPIRKTVSFNLPAVSSVSAATNAPAAQSNTDKDNFVAEQDKSSAVLQSGNLAEILIYFFLGGLALAFTACMYPMIPILSSIIVGQGEKVTTSSAFSMSLVYIEAMAITFGIMGAVVAAFAGGVNLQAYFQSPWILIPFSFLFVALAFSMFGFYSIQMPASLQGKLSEISNKQSGGSFIGIAIMGALSALIIGPCAGPVVIGALAVAAKEGNILLGFLSMFVLGNGLGLPLLIVGTTGGKFMPKAGTWMDTVKAGAGAVLLAIAILFLERISFISPTFIMLLWASYFMIVGVYLGALDAIKEGASGWYKLWKGLGLVFIIYGVIVMVGGVTGARNFNDPLHGSSLTTGGGTVEKQHLAFKRIKSDKDLEKEIAAAKAAGKYIMLDFYADWCTYCKKFEDYVFSDKNVQALLKDFVLLQADVTANDAQDQALGKMTKVQAPPAILFFGKDGKEIRNYRIVGNMDAATFIKHVTRILSK